MPFDSLNSTLEADIANKSGNPDVYWADQPRISALAFRGEATDLTAAFSQYKSDFDASPYESGMYDGKVWAVPIPTRPADVLQQGSAEGGRIPFPSADVNQRMTWEEVAAEAKKAVDAARRTA